MGLISIIIAQKQGRLKKGAWWRDKKELTVLDVKKPKTLALSSFEFCIRLGICVNLLLFLFFKRIAKLLVWLVFAVVFLLVVSHGFQEGKNIAAAAIHFTSNQFLGGGIENSTRDEYSGQENEPKHDDKDDD